MNNIKKALIWCMMLGKRSLKNPVLLISIIMIPILSLALSKSTDNETGIIKVGLYAMDGSDSTGSKIIKDLNKSSDLSIRYIIYENEDQLKKDIYTSRISIGFIFEETFDKKIKQYTYSLYNPHIEVHPITCLYLDSKKDSIYNTLAKESVFNSIYEELARNITISFADTKLSLSEEDYEFLKDSFETQETAENFFKFTFLGDKDMVITGEDTSGYLMLPLKGLILSLILLSAIAGGTMLFTDRENGLFNMVPISHRLVTGYAYCIIPPIFTAVFGFLGLTLSHVGINTWFDVIRFILFIPLVGAITLLFTYITQNINLYMGISILYLLINLIMCPVFVNIQGFIPGGKIIRYFLALHYGL